MTYNEAKLQAMDQADLFGHTCYVIQSWRNGFQVVGQLPPKAMPLFTALPLMKRKVNV